MQENAVPAKLQLATRACTKAECFYCFGKGTAVVSETSVDQQEWSLGARRLAEALRGAIEPVNVETGDAVVCQGEAGQTLYLIESGALDVVVTADEGLRLPVARLGPGSHFGEMSLLTGAAVSADVVASEPSRLYAVDAGEFEQLIRPNQELMEYLAGELAKRLTSTNARLAAQEERSAALGKLMGASRGLPFTTDLPGFNKKLTTAIAAAADSDDLLLIRGEDGIGKRSLAQHIHSLSSRSNAAALVVDCQELNPDTARAHLFGDASPDHVTRFADRLGYIQAADGGTLILAHVDRLPKDVYGDLETFAAGGPGRRRVSEASVRLIVTTTTPEGRLTGPLAEGQAVELAPLRKRRRDVIPLAEYILGWAAGRGDAEPKTLAEGARRELLAYDFSLANVAELQGVMILAAQLADGDVIDAEHLFFGPGGGTEAAQADLSGWPWLEQHLRSGKALIALRVFVGLFFASIVVACGLSPDTMFGWWANLLTWGVWWPVLVVSLLVLGRVWCAVCPLAGVGELAQKLGGRGIDPPDWLKHWAPSVTLVGFVAIIWVEQVTHMTEYPQHTSVFLLTLALLAVVFSWLLQRHAWCRYLCPLGAMGAVFSVASTLRVRAQREVCGGQCVGNECYKGSDVAQGCPMFTHALFRTHGQHCKLCMECLRSCPTGSPRLILQPPLRDIWGSDLIAADMAPLAVVVGMMAMVMAATTANSVTPEMARWLFSGGSAASVVLGLALTAFLRQRQKTSGSRDVGWVARAIYAFVPAIAALMFAFHLRSIPWLPDMLFRFGTPSGDVVGFSLLHFGQWTGAVLGAGMTLWALWPICRMRFEPGESVKSGGAWIALSGLALSSLTLGILWLG